MSAFDLFFTIGLKAPSTIDDVTRVCREVTEREPPRGTRWVDLGGFRRPGDDGFYLYESSDECYLVAYYALIDETGTHRGFYAIIRIEPARQTLDVGIDGMSGALTDPLLRPMAERLRRHLLSLGSVVTTPRKAG